MRGNLGGVEDSLGWSNVSGSIGRELIALETETEFRKFMADHADKFLLRRQEKT
jgi:hypothetical protein